MGFDIYGIKPSNQDKPDSPNWDDQEQVDAYFAWQENTKGAYFRANIWTWHPIWDFVMEHCFNVIEEHIDEMDCEDMENLIELCHYNDGFKIPDVVSKKIAQKLYELDKVGALEQKEIEDDYEKSQIPLEKCHCCNGVGTRKGWEGWESEEKWLETHSSLEVEYEAPSEKDVIRAIESGYSLKPKPVSYSWAHQMKGCNACHGSGKTEPFELSYRFRAEMVREFAGFCDNSGGFQIW
jgi:hypothetical protein